MWIIIFILKILGILLAAVFALLVLALVYLLFAPVTYRVTGQRKAQAGLEVAGYDLLRLVRVFVVYEKKQWRYGVRLLWGLVGKERTRGNEDNEGAGDDVAGDENVGSNEDGENGSLADEAENASVTVDDGVIDNDEVEDRSAVIQSEDDTESDIKSSSVSKPEISDRQGKKNGKSKTKADRHSSKTKKTSDTSKIRNPREPGEPDDTITEPESPIAIGAKRIKDEEPSRLEKLQKMLSHPGNQRAFSILWNGGIRLLYHARPHIKKADGSFSTGAPDTTGELVGVIAMLPAAHDGNVHLNPDFESEKPYATGIIDVYGRLQLWFVAVFAVRVIASKDCRRLYRQFRKL